MTAALAPAEMVDLDRRVALALGHKVEPTLAGTLWAQWLVDGDEWLANYCGDWREGGPVIDAQSINLSCVFNPCGTHAAPVGRAWLARHPDPIDAAEALALGPTPLIAAMRALVVARKIPA